MNLWSLLGLRGEQGYSWRNSALVMFLTRGFFEKKQFRAYKEFTASTVIKAVFTKPFHLHSQVLYCDTGAARAVISTGGVEGGAFVDVPTKFCKYLLDGPVTGGTTLTTGGTVTGGNEREVMRVSCGQGGNSATAATSLTNTRALPAGTYYITITVTGTTSGVYALEWEELDPIF